MYNLLNLERLSKVVDEIKLKFVQKTSGKDLSSNDYTDLDKQKLEGIESNADKNKIELIKKNGVNVPIGSDKSVDITIPTKLSDLTNDRTFKTEAEIRTLIQDVGKIKKAVVDVLPEIIDADENTIYLMPLGSGTGYSEWMVIENEWNKLGDTDDLDLSGYVKHSDISIITVEDIDSLFNF